MKNKIFKFPQSKIALRLWCMMMGIVLTCALFLWLVQVPLFEHNYVTAVIAQAESRLALIAEQLKTADLLTDAELLPYISRTLSGKTILADSDGNILQAFSYGLPIEQNNLDFVFRRYIQNSPCYAAALTGKQSHDVIYDNNMPTTLELAIPVTYDNHQAVVLLCNSMPEILTVKNINQRQLIILSVVLMFITAILAWILSKRFTRPIHTIKDTVDRLAQGELDAAPGLALRDELGQLSNSVEALGVALQRIDVLKKEVIANVSHELRSPLALIVGYSEMVRDISWSDEQARNENMSLIIREAQRLSQMVDDIMDYSQFQAGFINLNKEEYNLYDIISSEVEFSRLVTADFDINIEMQSRDKEIPVYVDGLKISQVIRNLLNNAINHTTDHETIIVSIQKQNNLVVSVSNPGKPIPPEKIEMIWERYYSSQHQGTRRQGTGIGLSIVKTILDAHGFTYGVVCENGYNRFWFEVITGGV